MRGDSALERSQITLKAMMKTIKKSKGGLLVELTPMQPIEETPLQASTHTCQELSGVLEQFKKSLICPMGYLL